MSSPRQDALPPPQVPPEVYDERYYLEACAGYEEWRNSDGKGEAGVYPGTLARAGLRAGETLVDLGTGRGELLASAIDAGAAAATGIEYSPDAVRMAERTLEARGAGELARVIEGDVRAVPLPDSTADLVTMLDVVEHLAPAELTLAYGEAHRLLRPGGRVLVHTAPNRTVYELTYRLQRLARPGRRRRWPADPRNDYEREMHVNEQTPGSLRGGLRDAGFERIRTELGEWVYTDFVPDERAKRLYSRLARLGPARRLAMMDLWAEGRKRA